MRALARASFACLTLALGLACDAEPETPDGSDDPPLDGRTFLSQRVTEDGADRALVSAPLRLEFHEASRSSASAGCNSAGGAYAIEQGELVVTDMSVTEIGCDPPSRHEQDDWYFGFLAAAPSLALDGDTLVLERDGTRIEYLDREVATPDLPLVGTTWTVNTIIDGNVAIGADWTVAATLVFAEQTVDIATGCNSGSGAYRVIADTIEFDAVVVTEEACTDELSGGLETAVLRIVLAPEPVAWEIDVAALSLLGADGSGLILRGE